MRLAFLLGNEFQYVGWRTKVGFCKVAVPTPLNSPSQRIENHGLDPNVEIVPKGTLSWGSRASSSGSNVWLYSAPNADGGSPSSGGSGTRPSTSESDRTNVPVANAWGSNSRPSTASGSLTSNQTSLRPKSVETRHNSLQGVKSYKEDGFSLSSGDFPTLGSEKENSVMNTKSQENSRPSSASERTAWAKEEDAKFHADGQRGTTNTLRTDGPLTAEDGIFPRMENWQGEPQQYFNTNIPSQHFDTWYSPLFNGPACPWYRGRPPGPAFQGHVAFAFRGHVSPGGFQMEPFPYYPPQISHLAVGGAESVPPAGSGPRGTHPRHGDLFRPPMSDAYVRPGIPFRPGFYRGPPVLPGQMTFEGYYGPPRGYCSNEREIPFMTPRPPSYNGFQELGVHDPNFPGGSFGHGPSGETLPVQMEADHQSQQRVPSKNHNDWYRKDEEETWDVKAGDYVNALTFFTKLLMGGASVDSVLLASVLAASSQLVILGPGCEIHGYAVRHERDTEVMVSSALVDMYAKCGFLESGIRVFRNMVDRNIVSYNSVISGLGLYGRAGEAFKVFEELLENGIKPDEATFSALLCACCHAGLVNKGRQYFKRMRDEFGIQAKTEHHVYMVKILGMDGQLKEAYGFIKSLPEPVHCSVWGALLSCCDAYSTNELPEVIADHLIKNKWRNRSYDVMLSNLYAGKGRWNDVKQLRVDSGGAKGKIPGISWIGA